MVGVQICKMWSHVQFWHTSSPLWSSGSTITSLIEYITSYADANYKRGSGSQAMGGKTNKHARNVPITSLIECITSYADANYKRGSGSQGKQTNTHANMSDNPRGMGAETKLPFLPPTPPKTELRLHSLTTHTQTTSSYGDLQSWGHRQRNMHTNSVISNSLMRTHSTPRLRLLTTIPSPHSQVYLSPLSNS